jgi:hypothetical protein
MLEWIIKARLKRIGFERDSFTHRAIHDDIDPENLHRVEW